MSELDGIEIVPLRWYPAGWAAAPDATIGLVAVVDRGPGHAPFFKVYIGLAGGQDTRSDAARIAHHGAPLMDEPLARLLAGPRWRKMAYAR